MQKNCATLVDKQTFEIELQLIAREIPIPWSLFGMMEVAVSSMSEVAVLVWARPSSSNFVHWDPRSALARRLWSCMARAVLESLRYFGNGG